MFLISSIIHNAHILSTENFDYVPVDKMVSFQQGQCVNVTILSNDLSEGAESFRVYVFSSSSSHVTMAVVWIMNNSECI